MQILSKPEGATIHINGELIGTAPVELGVKGPFDHFVTTCVNATCSKNTLFGFLKTKDVAHWWWKFTAKQRERLAKRIVGLFASDYVHSYRTGKSDCKGGEGEWKEANCLHNGVLHWLRLGETEGWSDRVSSCYWRRYGLEYCYSEFPTSPSTFKGCFGLPAYPVIVVLYKKWWAHMMTAIQIKKDTRDFNSWLFFNFGAYPKPGNWQMPCGTTAEDAYVRVENPTGWKASKCGTNSYNHIAIWRLTKECKVH